MNRKGLRKGYIIVAMIVILFLLIGFLPLSAIRQLQGTARVVNYTAIVRGASQKLVKEELAGYQDDALVKRIDTIIEELLTGEGPNGLVVPESADYLDSMREVQTSWVQLKAEIQAVRAGGDGGPLYEVSQDFYEVADRAVNAAENYAQNCVASANWTLIAVIAAYTVLLAVALVGYVRGLAIKDRAEALEKTAYTDPLTQTANRARCDLVLDRYRRDPAVAELGIVVLDLNNLKQVNETLGHQGGDRMIVEFARILQAEMGDRGFLGRYEADKFLVIFEDAEEAVIVNFLTGVNEKVVSHNLVHLSGIERLSFAVGYSIGSPRERAVGDLLYEADRHMFERKRQMREHHLDE